jgi:hypothetical protein
MGRESQKQMCGTRLVGLPVLCSGIILRCQERRRILDWCRPNNWIDKGEGPWSVGTGFAFGNPSVGYTYSPTYYVNTENIDEIMEAPAGNVWDDFEDWKNGGN